MKFYKEGEKSRAICSCCKKQVTTTFRARNVPLSKGKGTVPDVLVGVCDVCDAVVSLPQQSAPKVAETIAKRKKPVEARIPIHVKDMMLQTLLTIGVEPQQDYLPVLINHFILKAYKDKNFAKQIHKLLESDFLNAANSARISMKMNPPIWNTFEQLMERLDVKPTDLVKAIAVFMQKEVLEKSNKKEIDALREQIIIAS